MKRSIALFALLMLTAACATQKPLSPIYVADVPLKPVAGNASLRAWEKRPGVLGEYQSFLLEPVIVTLDDSAAPNKTARPEELQNLSNHLRQAFVDELTQAHYNVVTSPGKGVLRVRTALTELIPVDPAANVSAKVAGSFAGPAGLFIPTVDIGHAAIEVDMRDGVTDARIAAFVDRKAGRRYFNGLRPYRRWGDVESAFRDWARAFRVSLDQSHPGHAKAAGGS